MKIRVPCLGLLAGLTLAWPALAAPVPTTWITVGDAVYLQMQKVAPGLVSKESRLVGTNDATEKVHLVAIDEADLFVLTAAIHESVRQCGGYMFHASEAEAKAALGSERAVASHPSYAIDNQALVGPLLLEMRAENIEATIAELSRPANRYYSSPAGAEASNSLMQKWAAIAAGRTDIAVAQFAHSAYKQQSVILTMEGSDNAAEMVVLGAHLDSINSMDRRAAAVAPGSDDDASGIASMTEALRAMVARGYRPRRTIKMIAYAAEEVGLRGSQEIARSFKSKNANVVGVMQLDMTNYKGASKDIYLFTDYTDSMQNDFIGKLIGTYLPALTIGYDRCGYACSDHASWNAQGYATSMPFESTFARDNPYIHTDGDTYAHSGSQAVHALKFAQLAAAFAVELASDGPAPTVTAGR